MLEGGEWLLCILEGLFDLCELCFAGDVDALSDFWFLDLLLSLEVGAEILGPTQPGDVVCCECGFCAWAERLCVSLLEGGCECSL